MNSDAFERWLQEEGIQDEDAQIAWLAWQAAVRAERIRFAAIMDASRHKFVVFSTMQLEMLADEVLERPVLGMPKPKK